MFHFFTAHVRMPDGTVARRAFQARTAESARRIATDLYGDSLIDFALDPNDGHRPVSDQRRWSRRNSDGVSEQFEASRERPDSDWEITRWTDPGPREDLMPGSPGYRAAVASMPGGDAQ